MILSSNDIYIVKSALASITEGGQFDLRMVADAKKLLEEIKFRNYGGFSFSRNSQGKELHITEQKYPQQTKRFREILEEMYRVHLVKNNDYSN